MNYFIEVVCKAIEVLVRYDQEGNVLLRSAVIHLKQDGRRSIYQLSFPGFVFVLLLDTGVFLARRLLQ